MYGIAILGSTGSIGQNTLDVVARYPDRFKVIALSAQKNINILLQQCRQFRPDYAVVVEKNLALQFQQKLREENIATEVLAGAEALMTIAIMPEAHYVMAAIVGAAGLPATLAAARSGKRVLLANKEALVMSGALFMQAVREHQAVLLPIDSEHNALFQCMPPQFITGNAPVGVNKIILTASGGPFRTLAFEALSLVSPEQACAHPNWKMGQKISVDSATMMNKGLEVIEAHWLFQLPDNKIEVLLHPQSVIHSLVEYLDGSTLAQLGNPDMRVPIAHALAWPERIHSGVAGLDLLTTARLDFAPICKQRYPALQLAYAALKEGGTTATILNAANEVAVQAFLQRRISFTDIYKICAETMTVMTTGPANNLADIMEADRQARFCANEFLSAEVA